MAKKQKAEGQTGQGRVKELRLASSGSKIINQLIIFLVIGILPIIFPSKISINNQIILFFNLLLALLSSIAFEIWRTYLEKRDRSTDRLMVAQLMTSVVLLTLFLHLFTRINGPLFILYLLTVMESALNLNVTLPNLVVGTMLISTVGEFFYLASIKEIALNFITGIELVVRIAALIFMRSYGFTLAQTIIKEKEERTKATKLAEDLKKAMIQVKLHAKELSEKTKFLAALRRLDLIIMEALDLESFCQKIVDALAGELKCQYGLIGLVNETENRFYFQAITAKSKLAKAMAKKRIKIEEVFLPIENSSSLLTRTIETKKEASTNNFADVFPSKEATNLKNVVKARTFWIYPMVSKGKVLGVLVFGWKKAERELSSREKDMMQNVVDQTSIALDNTLLYEKLKDNVNKLKRANIRLRELDRMKDEFVSIASHELRTPMTSVNNYVWMVLNGKGGKITTKQRFYLDRAAISTKRLINLVEDMLTVSRVEGGKLQILPTPGEIVILAKSVIEEIESKAKMKKIKLTLETPKKPISLVMMDQDRIREVFVNLIGNAIKFTDSGGEVKIYFRKKGKYVSTVIADTGRGIAKADIPKLFKKFGRLDRSFATVAETGGTGLGLYICKQIIDLHHGKIGVRSKLNVGSSFHFELKVAKEVKISNE